MGVSRGFTLLELLVVLAVMALVYAVAVPLVGGNSSVDLKAGTRQVAAGLRRARSVAITQRQEATLTLDVEKRRFAVSGDPKTYSLPAKLDVSLYTAQSELVEDKSAANIRFYPDGSSTGGRVTLAADNRKLSVDVDWLTGKVSIE